MKLNVNSYNSVKPILFTFIARVESLYLQQQLKLILIIKQNTVLKRKNFEIALNQFFRNLNFNTLNCHYNSRCCSQNTNGTQ